VRLDHLLSKELTTTSVHVEPAVGALPSRSLAIRLFEHLSGRRPWASREALLELDGRPLFRSQGALTCPFARRESTDSARVPSGARAPSSLDAGP